MVTLKVATEKTEALTSSGGKWRAQGSGDISCINGSFILTEERFFVVVVQWNNLPRDMVNSLSLEGFFQDMTGQDALFSSLPFP